MEVFQNAEKPRRRDYEKILSTLETRWKRRPAERAKIMQDIVEALWEVFGGKIVSWCGFYLLASDGQPSVLGPHEDKTVAPDAPRGACERAAGERKTQNVSDSGLSQDGVVLAEIAVPVMNPDGDVFAVLNMHSTKTATFGEEDRRWLERLMRILGQTHVEHQL